VREDLLKLENLLDLFNDNPISIDLEAKIGRYQYLLSRRNLHGRRDHGLRL
jgi:hypothetical protein